MVDNSEWSEPQGRSALAENGAGISWIDSHCHLDLITADPISAVLKQAQAAGLEACITIGTRPASNRSVLALCEQYALDAGALVYGTLGIHPHYANKCTAAELDFMKEQLSSNDRLVALGECGFDYHYNKTEPQTQRAAFEQQLELALELDMPVVVHSREAEEDTAEVLRPFLQRGLSVVLHSFTSKPALAHFGLDFGTYFSFNGISTFKNGAAVRDILQNIPHDRILLETDAPYLAPVPLRGKPNQPAYVAMIGEYIADFLQVPLLEFAAKTSANTRAFYRLVQTQIQTTPATK